MIRLVGYCLFLLCFEVQALVPVEGILLGTAKPEIQTDPLESIFSNVYDLSSAGENKKIKLYYHTYKSGENLVESCSVLQEPRYSTPWQENQAKKSTVATLQYIGLDTTIKAIGAYAKKMEVSEEDFNRLASNLVNNYCSKNVTVFSLKNIEKSLKYYYANPSTTIIPSVLSSPFATEKFKNLTEATASRSREFDLVISQFRSFCSWGNDTDDYRMLTHYLNNRYVMAFVFKNMLGMQDIIDEKGQSVVTKPSDATVQVLCRDFICRKETQNFRQKFPLSSGSTGLSTDLARLYCHHFRFQDAPKNTLPEVRAWLKSQELEDPIFESSHFIALMTGVPDVFSGVESYIEMPLLLRSSVDERWSIWSKTVLGTFSKGLLFEESLKIKVDPRGSMDLALEGFSIDFSVTLGEMDRLIIDNDKLDLKFELKLSKNYLRSLKTKWNDLEKEVDNERQKELRKEIAQYIQLHLVGKEKFFSQKMWNEDFSKLIANELLRQVLKYQGSMFNSYEDKMVKIPIKFSYGLFAISYLRYRADIASGRLKLNL